jgi:hypothetical protein
MDFPDDRIFVYLSWIADEGRQKTSILFFLLPLVWSVLQKRFIERMAIYLRIE